MTFAEIKTDVTRRLEESAISPKFWTETQIGEAINDGYEELSDATEWSETSQSVNLTTSTYYDLSTALSTVPLTVTRVFNVQTDDWLIPTTIQELDNTWARWEDATGEPHRFMIRGLWWLGVFPKAPAASGTLVVHFSGLPTALSADGDTPALPREFHLGLVEYAVYDLLCQDGETKKAQKFYEKYLIHEEKLRRYVQGRPSWDRSPSMLVR